MWDWVFWTRIPPTRTLSFISTPLNLLGVYTERFGNDTLPLQCVVVPLPCCCTDLYAETCVVAFYWQEGVVIFNDPLLSNSTSTTTTTTPDVVDEEESGAAASSASSSSSDYKTLCACGITAAPVSEPQTTTPPDAQVFAIEVTTSAASTSSTTAITAIAVTATVAPIASTVITSSVTASVGTTVATTAGSASMGMLSPAVQTFQKVRCVALHIFIHS